MNYFKILLPMIIASVLACNGGGGGQTVTPGNTPPVVTEVTLTPINPTIHAEITAQILSQDKDGDPITYKIKWFVNNAEVGEGQLFKYEDIKQGDAIFAEVTPFDGKDWGKAKRSTSVTIQSSKPRVLSVKVVPAPVYANTPQLTVDAMVEDLDQDAVNIFCHYIYHDRLLTDTLPVLNLGPLGLKKHDTLYTAVYAADSASQSEPFQMTIIISNAPPSLNTEAEILKLRMDNINYPVPISDPDGDAITFELVNPPAGLTIDRNTGVINGNLTGMNSVEVTVRATDSEGAYLDSKFTLTEQP